MALTGPQLPSPAAISEKRKRDESDTEEDNDSSSDSDTGPALPPTNTIPEPAAKKTRVIGPALPPTSATPTVPAQSDTDDGSSDDDFGPQLPSKDVEPRAKTSSESIIGPRIPSTTTTSSSAPASKRDDWMIVPPSNGDWTSRVDPTKLKNRKFNTGKTGKGLSTSDAGGKDMWYETPQEKQARLQREMMGIKDTDSQPTASARSADAKVDAETARRLKEYNKSRGPSLYDAHQGKHGTEKEDDPSARAFDREKDIGGGLQINSTKRREMLEKAADFSSKFSSARYL